MMLNFSYVMPTKVIFGKETEEKAAEEIKALGCKKVLLHYGGESANKYGLLDRIRRTLDANGVEYVELGGVVPNPRLSLVREGIALCKQQQVDFILAIGGGSVIDSAKAIGYGATHERDVWDFYTGKATPNDCTPIGVVLTVAGAGSETSDGSVITNEEGMLKRDCGSNFARPKFAILNPELTYTLPDYQTASAGADILMHAMERYFTMTPNVELIDGLIESLMRTVMRNLRVVLREDSRDYNARAEVMWAASICHNGLLSTGRKGDWATHRLEQELNFLFDSTHGAGLSAIWGSWARYVCKTDIDRFVKFAVHVMGCSPDKDNPEKTALEGIEAMEAYLRSIGMPTKISDMGIQLTHTQVEEMAQKCTSNGNITIGNFRVLDQGDVTRIYTMAI